MDNLGEYDESFPCPRAYSRRLTTEEHEAVVSAETEKQLNLLLTHLEQNPKVFSKLLKKRKIKEMEEGGLFSNLKVKVLSTLYGEDFVDDIDVETCNVKLKEFESTSIKVYNYSQEAKGNCHRFSRRYSKRIAEKQLAKEQDKPKIPTPPPPPPIMKQPQKWTEEHKVVPQVINCKQAPHISNSSTDDGESAPSIKTFQKEIKSMSKSIVKRQPLHEVSTNPTRNGMSNKGASGRKNNHPGSVAWPEGVWQFAPQTGEKGQNRDENEKWDEKIAKWLLT